MNITRRTPLSFSAFFLELCCFGVLEVVSNVSIAILRAGIDIQDLFCRCRSGKIGEQFMRASEPSGDCQVTADVCKCILERVSVPEADAVPVLQTMNRFGSERLNIGAQQFEVTLVETR